MYGEKYGVPRDIYAKIKIIGLLILDITFVGITGLIALSVGLRIFPKSQWIQNVRIHIFNTSYEFVSGVAS